MPFGQADGRLFALNLAVSSRTEAWDTATPEMATAAGTSVSTANFRFAVNVKAQ
jgi:hypothetical protein